MLVFLFAASSCIGSFFGVVHFKKLYNLWFKWNLNWNPKSKTDNWVVHQGNERTRISPIAASSSLLPPPLSFPVPGLQAGPITAEIALIPPSHCKPNAKASGKFYPIPGTGILINAKRKFVFVVMMFFPKDQGWREGRGTSPWRGPFGDQVSTEKMQVLPSALQPRDWATCPGMYAQ